MDSNASNSSDDSSKAKKKQKKHKSRKEKKIKKSKRRHRSSSSDKSSSSGEEQWVEATEVKSSSKLKLKDKKSKKKDKVKVKSSDASEPIVPREGDAEEWSNFGEIFPTFSNDTKRSQKQKEREEQRTLSSIDRTGQTDRELNPYWKDGGRGLPQEEKETKPKAASAVGDGGLAWLKKSFQRAKQQAQDEGKPLEEVVALRWGSLEAFYALLQEAEDKAGGDDDRSDKYRTRNKEDEDRSRKSFKRPSRYSDSDGDRSSHRDNRRRDDSRRSHHVSSRHRDGDRRREERPSWRKEKPPSSRRQESGGSKELEEVRTRVEEIRQNQQRAPPPVVQRSKSEDEMEVDDNGEENVEEPTPNVLTDKEMNELNAKIFKAELMGDAGAVESLKSKLEEAKKARDEYIKSGKVIGAKPVKVITKVILGSQDGRRRTKDKPTESHKEGQRVRYFPDDDRHSLKSMFEKEKMNTVEDENIMFSRLMAKGSKATEDYDVDDIFVDKASSSRQSLKDQKREIKNVLDEEKAANKVLDDCAWCFDGKHLQKNLIVSIGQNVFLCVPPFQSLTEGHCLIVPMSHVTCATQLDEDVWAEMQKFRKALVRMFLQSDEDAVFFETAIYLRKQPHMYLECVPMPKETGELAPIYFKKAIQECETEWAQNKKVVDLKDRDVRRAVPKGLPYFSVDFGDDNCGFAHVIEDERSFPKNFAQEIIGGMMELDHGLWRKQKREDFNLQRAKLMNFVKMWSPFDFTKDKS